jgi:RNA polymerase sigma factor (sigma-70 family)
MKPRCPALVLWLSPHVINYGQALASRYARRNPADIWIDRDDIDQEAVIGLMSALDHFNVEKLDHTGGWLYICYYVRLYVRRRLYQMGSGPAYIPRNLQHKMRTYSAFSLDYLSDNSPRAYEGIRLYNKHVLSGVDDGRVVVSCENQVNARHDVDAILRVARKVLSKRNYKIWYERRIKGRLLSEVGEQWGITRERVRQIDNASAKRIDRFLDKENNHNDE